MNLEALIAENESKILDFKESAQSLSGIIKTVVAFANTAGGTIVIGVEDRTKKIVGVLRSLDEEERLVSAISDSIAPFLIPNIEIQTYRKKELILIHVPHLAGPFYVKSMGSDKIRICIYDDQQAWELSEIKWKGNFQTLIKPEQDTVDRHAIATYSGGIRDDEYTHRLNFFPYSKNNYSANELFFP